MTSFRTLEVARRKQPAVDWREAPAEALPLDSDDFDAVVSQLGSMFFTDKQAALREMGRILRPGGRLAIAVWDSLDNTPGYAGITSLLARLFGDDIAQHLKSPYSMGDPQALASLLSAAGFEGADVVRVAGEARFPSICSWMQTDVRGWTLADKLDDDQYERRVVEAERELHGFVTAEGAVRFDHPALVATACKPA